ncbi:MAG TPA: ATP-binding cassette domain-containing protein [Candidatus Thiothrix moscowensis]|uniref:ABC transporter ATP-binding protein n=1 Tax=unclassified Thiothrix TaxID=2636184 RepID=UPI001A1853EA|nr:MULTISPECIES: ATP-binding cassette domain-containing protein [unclassified Thiothrix]MBJ6609871.1 ATP-binding cassette domain-containing protein [Candidatus Thiothrix moscowensis]HRJ52548.1 ATP-binding cassette domain-containing protein [Candidatus Thiothrix moscowensis]HRJ94308.1 ATP-binding cassette domain-containing protein [Candidatus Thiothrix moscowensis]
MNNTAIQTNNLVKTIPQAGRDLQILRGISLHIDKGESVAITGMSGSGKSTLLGLLAGLDLPTSGTVQLFGQSLDGLDEDQRAALRLGKVGFVFQSFHLLENLTALENVMLPLELNPPTHPGLPPQGGREQRAREALQQVGLGERLSHFPNQLSGGEQQRVALARAFVTRPQILFADEPTGNLDRATGHEISDLLFALQEQVQTTLVLVTHDETLAARCQRHYRMEEGRLA